MVCVLFVGVAPTVLVAQGEIVAPPAPTFQTTLSAGFDSFGDSYSIDEADTLDVTNEVRSVVGVRYAYESPGGHRLEASNRFGISDQAVRNELRVAGKLALSRRARLDVTNQLSVKRFGDEFTVASDHVLDILRTVYRFDASDAATLRLSNRLEWIAFAERNEFEYDYRRYDVGAALEVDGAGGTFADFGYDFRYRDVPDSTSIRYRSHALSGSLLSLIGSRSSLDLRTAMERRRYDDPEVRPGYYRFEVDGRYGWRFHGANELALRQEVEVYSYDIPGTVYFNSTLARTGVELGRQLMQDLRVSIEPRAAWMVAEESSEESYGERSVLLGADWLVPDRVWLNLAFELGERDYEEPVGDMAAIFSDYAFARVNALSTVEFGKRYACNLFFSYEPERHDNDNDDTTMTLFSSDFTVTF